MPSTSLISNLNSDYLAASSAMQAKNTPQKVLVYVESDTDIGFWRIILQDYQRGIIQFDIQLPVKDNLAKGKKEVLKNIGGVGTHLILCVDSDYDYLLQNTTETSRQLKDNRFVFQTYTYSVENLQCYSPSLHGVCTQASHNDNQIFDFEGFLSTCSKHVYPLFLWSIYFSFENDVETFSINEFCKIVSIADDFRIADNGQKALNQVITSVETKISVLSSQFPNQVISVNQLANELNILGLNPENTYLFVQGHHLKNDVILPILDDILGRLKTEKFDQIKALGKNTEEQNNQRNGYQKSLKSVKTVLELNQGYKSCFLFGKIKTDLESYINNFQMVKINPA